MRVFKFGGASIKNAEAVKNVLQLLQHTGYEDTFIWYLQWEKPPMH